MRLSFTCEETCQSVWPSNASLFASSTCRYLLVLASPFDQGLTQRSILMWRFPCRRSFLNSLSNNQIKASVSPSNSSFALKKGRRSKRRFVSVLFTVEIWPLSQFKFISWANWDVARKSPRFQLLIIKLRQQGASTCLSVFVGHFFTDTTSHFFVLRNSTIQPNPRPRRQRKPTVVNLSCSKSLRAG